jgi:hypothetical protein
MVLRVYFTILLDLLLFIVIKAPIYNIFRIYRQLKEKHRMHINSLSFIIILKNSSSTNILFKEFHFGRLFKRNNNVPVGY